jgi:hypothetical protein
MLFICESIEVSVTRQVMLASPRGHAAILRTPFVEASVAHSVFMAKFCNWNTVLCLSQYSHYLRVAKS